MSVEEKAEARADGDAVVGEKKKRDSDDEAGDLAGEDRPATVRAKVDTSESDAALARALGGVPDADVEASVAPNLGLSEGDRLEVRWVITDDDDEDTVVWWPCTLRAIVPSGPSASWELHYDADEAHGFAAEVRPATFTNSRWVHDPGEGQHLRWRREGSTEDDVDDDDDAGDADDPNIVYAAEIDPDEGDLSLEDLVNRQRVVDAERNGGEGGLEAAGMATFASLPMERQHAMAGAFLDMKERITSLIKELQARHGPGYVITKDDIDEALGRK